MERSDLRELRKVIKSKETVIDWIYSIYVDSDNQLCYEDITRLIDMEDAEKFRHLNLFARVLSTRVGMDSFPVRLQAQQDFLLGLRSEDGRDLSVFETFRDHMLESYAHTDPYYATLVRVVYDVPSKAKDGRRLEDGELVYEALLLAICPAKLSKPVLGYDVDHVGELDRRWQIGNPACGFLYPAFDNRGEDRNEVLLYSANPDAEEYMNGLFGVPEAEAPVGVKAQREIFTSLIGQLDVGLTQAASISENILEKAAEQEEVQLAKEEIRKIAESAGVDTDAFDEIYEETVGDTPIAIAAVADTSVIVKTDTVMIKVPSDKAQLIETRTIDGRDYILIPADGTVTVNGAAVCAVPGAGRADGDED